MVSTLFVRQQLEYVQNEVVKQDFPERLILSGQVIPISNELPPGASTYSYKIMTALGSAKIMADGAQDLPEISAFMEERIGYIRTIANKFSYTLDDMERAQFAGMSIDSTLAVEARSIMEEVADRIGYTGDTTHKLLGMLNHPNVPEYTVLNDGTGSSTQWSTKTPAQIYRDLVFFARETKIQTKYVFSPDVIGLPAEQYDYIATTLYDINNGRTILEIFLENQRKSKGGVQDIIPMPYLDGLGTAGADIMVSFRRVPQNVKYHVAQDFNMLRTQEHDLMYTIPCRMKIGGVQVLKPLSMRYASGI